MSKHTITKEHVTEIKKLIQKLTKQKLELKTYYDYYKGKHNILTSYKENRHGSNLVEVHNYCGLFVDNNTGFLLGNPVQLKNTNDIDVNTPTLIDNYNHLVGSYIQQIDQQILKQQQIFGYTYEVNYINKQGSFAVDSKSPLEMAVTREGNKIIYGILERTRDSKGRIHYDFFNVPQRTITPLIVDKDKIVQIGTTLRHIIPNPIILIRNNWEYESELRNIISLNDAYNQVSSDLTNEIADHRSAYLWIDGVRIDKDVLAQAKSSGILNTTGNNSANIQFVTKNVNDSFVQNKLDQLERQIYNMASQVNFNDTSLGSNTSSLALRNKLTNLINHLSLKEGFLREGIVIRLRNLATYLAGTKNINPASPEFSPYDIKISFVKNIPTSDSEIADMVIALTNAGLLSKDSAIAELGFVDSARAELKKIEGEQENDISSDLKFLFGTTIDESQVIPDDRSRD